MPNGSRQKKTDQKKQYFGPLIFGGTLETPNHLPQPKKMTDQKIHYFGPLVVVKLLKMR